MNVYVCIILMFLVTYAIRTLPLLLLRKPIENRFVRSFLYYAPFVTLSVMTFPAIFFCTGNTYTALAGFAAALICVLFHRGLVLTTAASCAAVYAAQLIMGL